MVTHIIASSLTPKKVEEFKRYRIVKPAWIVDSVAAGKLLPWDAHRVVDEGVSQKVLNFENGNLQSQVNNKQRGYRDQTDSSWYTAQLNNNKNNDSTNSLLPGPFTRPTDDVEDVNFDKATEKAIPETRPEVESGRTVEELTPPSHQPELVESAPSCAAVGDVPDGITNQEEGSLSPNRMKRKEPSEENLPPAKRRLTAEEHNTILLSDPRIRNSSVLNPDFLEQYYRESRLHHLSTWKADLKSQLQALTAGKTASQKSRVRRAPDARRYIMHVDFDSFFVAVSLKSHPALAEKPACVAHGSGPNSEIASCNYPARAFGVKNGMWMKRAHELCTDLKVLPYDFPGYEAASRLFYDAILATDGIVQSVSIDEALVDITHLCSPSRSIEGQELRDVSTSGEQEKANEIAQHVRDTIKEQTGCAVSVGIGNNILLAKVALRKAKPAGQYQVKPEDAMEFVGRLEVQDLPGVAWSIGGKLDEIGIKLVKDIRETNREKLVSVLGPKTGEKLWNYSRGIDKTEVGEQVIRKSVSAEVNWGVRFETQEQAEEFVESLCGEVQRRLAKEGVKGKSMTMKIMRRAEDAPLDPPKHLGHGKCDTYNKSVVLGVATNDKSIIAREAISILRSYGFSPGELRGLGVQITKLEPLKDPSSDISSQKRLQFKTALPPKEESVEDDIEEGPETPNKPNASHRPPAPGAGQKDSPSKKPLNTLGTQFLLPTQVDPKVLEELPADIRSKLMKVVPHPGQQEKPAAIAGIPNESQLDPSALEALPLELRAEVMAQYRSDQSARSGQALLPQSPRKTRMLPPPKKVAARGKPKGKTLFARTKDMGSTTLTQSNFVAAPRHVENPKIPEPDAPSEISSDFLEALPDDIRREVLAQQRAEHLKRKAGLQVQKKQRLKSQFAGQEPNVERTLILAPRPAKPTFTARNLSTLEELRQSTSAWFAEFKEDGPYEEDTEALGRYLEQVVKSEGNMKKAVDVVRWCMWIIDADEEATETWRTAVSTLRRFVNDAITSRGLGPVDFGE